MMSSNVKQALSAFTTKELEIGINIALAMKAKGLVLDDLLTLNKPRPNGKYSCKCGGTIEITSICTQKGGHNLYGYKSVETCLACGKQDFSHLTVLELRRTKDGIR